MSNKSSGGSNENRLGYSLTATAFVAVILAGLGLAGLSTALLVPGTIGSAVEPYAWIVHVCGIVSGAVIAIVIGFCFCVFMRFCVFAKSPQP